jgi:hypothetical protein
MSELTPEQIQAAADKAAAKAKAKADKAAVTAQKKAEREAAKASAKASRDTAKADKKAAKEQKKADALLAKEANRMPLQNEVRRPKPSTLCGKAWAVFDNVSAKNGSPAAISECLELTKAAGLNDSNVRAEYARWRKFHGISGRIAAPAAQAVAA